MLYLIKSGDYLKIGYSQDIKKRMQTYSTHNPDIALLDTIEGDESLEKFVHNLCKEFRVNNKQEWFHLNPFIIEVWNSLKDSEYVDIPKSEIPLELVNLDYKNKFEEVLYELVQAKETSIKYKEDYWKLRLDYDKLNKEIDDHYKYKQMYENLMKEYDTLKSTLLNTYKKYIELLEKDS